MPVTVLSSNNYLEFASLPEERGWNPTTHLAIVDFGNGRAVKAYVRLDPPQMALLPTEMLVYQLAEKAGIRVAENAAAIYLDCERLREDMPNLPEWVPQNGTFVAWASQAIAGRSIAMHFRASAARDSAITKWLGTSGGQKLAAFDEFVGIKDRVDQNLIYLSDSDIAAIDFGAALYQLPWNMLRDLNFTEHCDLVSFVERLDKTEALPATFYRKLVAAIMLYSKGHAGALADTAPTAVALHDAVGAHGDIENALSWLQARCTSAWMPNQFGELPE